MTVRKAFLAIHRWTGLAAFLFLFLTGVTGTAIAFFREIDAALNPDLFYVAERPAIASIDAAVRTAEATVPGYWVYHPDLPDRPGQSLKLFMKPGIDLSEEETGKSPQVFIDPHSGELLGWRDDAAISVDRRHLMKFLHHLHANLHLGETGTLLLGIVAAAWLLDHIWGTWLAFPKLAQWRRSFAVKRGAGALKTTYDTHRASGLWLWPVLATLALSGTAMNLDGPTRAVVEVFSPAPSRFDFQDTAPDRTVAPKGFDAAIAAAGRYGPVDKIRFYPDKGLYLAHVYGRGDRGKHGETDVMIDAADGRVISVHRPADDTAGQAFFAWQLPLHSGYAFGLVGRTLIAIAGSVVATLAVTGVILWYRRRTTKTRPSSRRAAPQAAG